MNSLTQQAPPQMLSRAEIIASANRYLPSTNDGLPAGFYRADLVPFEAPAQTALLPSNIDAAFTQLNYQEGFPSLPDGRPFWHKWDLESPEAFAAFEVYVSSAESGPRQLSSLLLSVELQRLYGERLTVSYLRELYTIYYWKERSKAFDLYQEAAYRHIRTRRAQSMENYHYLQAEALLTKVFQALGNEETFEALRHDPGQLLNAMDKLVKIQRISVGLPSTAPAESLKLQESTTDFEMTLRQIAQRNMSPVTNSQNTTVDESGRVIPNTDNLLRGALNDPNTAKMLQEVIIKISTKNGATKRPRWASSPNEEGEADIPSDETFEEEQ